MKLQQKLVLLTTLSKALMAAVLLLALPWIVETLALRHTDDSLRSEQQRVMYRIEQIGISSFLTDPSPNQKVHYDLLQDEFIDLRRATAAPPDTVATLPRQQHGELVDFRVLRHTFERDGQAYTVEIGKSIASVEDVYALLRSLAAYALAFAVLTTLFIELGVIRYLLRPVDQIVERLRAVQGPCPRPCRRCKPPLPTSNTWMLPSGGCCRKSGSCLSRSAPLLPMPPTSCSRRSAFCKTASKTCCRPKTCPKKPSSRL
ncbi:hypothetical protein [Hymenobacter cellulosilyticus]|uniref:Sensor histidine kinase n=1 Tax=Hymenobacter cellulosilyticus TaxID=2932248 RepID=A0A8T9QFG7_9BACT|nr:hypothetical protein [Hymenobacter cellulosilyticus]UOQ74560.1 hypothetical protein MUN79_12210 [Hymenobacter cellulosilyticus]